MQLLDNEIIKRVKRKQRYTAKKIFNILKEKSIYQGTLRTIENFVGKLRTERSQTKKKSYLPLEFPLGSALQVDHGEVDLVINNKRLKGYMFVATVPGEVLRYCQVYPIKSQEAWGEFHERSFNFFQGVFARVIYDNDTVLVSKVIGTERNQTDFSLAMEEHYGFESHFCNPASGNEKGSVENSVGYCRRNFLPGCPEFNEWLDINQFLDVQCIKDISEGRHYKTNQLLSGAFEELKGKLIALPPKRLWSKKSGCSVNTYQLVKIEKHEYSVPEKYVGSAVRYECEVFEVKIFKDNELIAQHSRKHEVGEDSLQLDHYLDQLQYKGEALWDCKATINHTFDAKFLEMWRRLSERHSKKDANRKFVKILLLGRTHSQEELSTAIDIALQYNAVDDAAVENILHQLRVQTYSFDEEGLRKELKSIEVNSWEFDLSVYNSLCGEVVS